MAGQEREWQPQGDGDQPALSVDTDATDPSKAIERHRQASAGDTASVVRRGEGSLMEERKDLRRRLSRQSRQFDQRLAESQAESQRQISKLTDAVNRLSGGRADSGSAGDATHDAKINSLKTQLEAAYEAGNSKKAADLQAEIASVEARFWAEKTATVMQGSQARAPGTRDAARGRSQDEDDEDDAPAPRAGAPSAVARKWRESNEHWYGGDEHPGETAYATAIYQAAKDDGEKDSPELFAKLTRQLKKQFPDLDVEGPAEPAARRDRDFTPQRGNDSPVISVQDGGGGDTGLRRRETAVNFTNSDIATMRQWGIDPSNDKQVQAWAAERRALERSESRA